MHTLELHHHPRAGHGASSYRKMCSGRWHCKVCRTWTDGERCHSDTPPPVKA